MKKIDYLLQNERIRQAKKFIKGNSLLDIGCHEGEIFESILKHGKIVGDGIDAVVKKPIHREYYSLYPGYFPDDFPVSKKYDNITLLAVLEHIPLEQLQKFPDLLLPFLNSKGRVIITVPTKYVDYILAVLLFFKLVKGMDLEHHQDFERSVIKDIFTKNGFKLIKEKRFELGLNILFVFEKLE